MNINQILGSAVPSAPMTLPISQSFLWEGNRDLFFTKGKFFSQAVSRSAPLLEQSVPEQKCKAMEWSGLFSGLSQAQLRADLTLALPAARPAPALHRAPHRQSLSARAALLTAEASTARLHSLPLGTPRSMLFYLTIPFPFPEFLERVWHRSRFFSFKCSLHMEIKTFRKV